MPAAERKTEEPVTEFDDFDVSFSSMKAPVTPVAEEFSTSREEPVASAETPLNVHLVAVLGYSDRRTDALDAICLERLRHAETLAAASARGEAHWNALGCTGCHTAEHAAAGVVPVTLRALGARYDIDSLTGFLAAPTPPMPPVALDEAARRDLAIHLLQRFR
jgi:hypothetical protein